MYILLSFGGMLCNGMVVLRSPGIVECVNKGWHLRTMFIVILKALGILSAVWLIKLLTLCKSLLMIWNRDREVPRSPKQRWVWVKSSPNPRLHILILAMTPVI